eukprot:14053370-Alexandrium_andersonii.AAC.1
MRPTATLVCAARIPARRPAHLLRTSPSAPMASFAGPSCARIWVTFCPAAAVRPTAGAAIRHL